MSGTPTPGSGLTPGSGPTPGSGAAPGSTADSGSAPGSAPTPVPDAAAPATRAARVLLQSLAALGVHDVVLAPGSRSAPLAYAAAEAALPADDPARDPAAPALRLHVRVDERAAAFLALGLARAARERDEPRPVAVVTTSGTAPAHLLPAALEARHSGLPLLLLTADRPHELRGTGANQTTDQPPLLAPAVRLTLDVPAPAGLPGEDRDLRNLAARAVAAALGTRDHTPGPVHLNLSYRDPLVPGADPWPAPSTEGLSRVLGHPGTLAGEALAAYSEVARPLTPPDGVPTVVVAGDGAGPEASVIAHANDWPLLAEPSSGTGGGRNAIPAYRLLLDQAGLGGDIRRVVVLGHPTLSRPIQALLARPDVEVQVIARSGRDWPDAARHASTVLPGIPGSLLRGNLGAGTDWLARWIRAGEAAAHAVGQVLATTPGEATGPLVAAVVAAALGPGDTLVVGASNPVRDLDLVARWDDPPLVVANRGLAGIDGTLGTASGLALGLGRPVHALVGDVTFLHDVGSLLVGPLEERPDLRVVVANDDGGSIFATLEHGAPELAPLAERVMSTPHGAALGDLCRGYGVPHRLVGVDALPAALREPVRGTSVLEVRVDRSGRRVLGRAVADAVREAVAHL